MSAPACRVPVLLGLLLLAACSDDTVVERVDSEFSEFLGIVAADEPRAAVVGQQVLLNGGNAADAAVAMYFALTVTYPSRAGLAGGGACVIYDKDSKGAEALVFLPMTAGGGGTVPLGPRAMAALQARYGSIPWPELVSPAERLARFGHDMSRALVVDFSLAGEALLQQEEARRIFAPNGVVEVGQQVVQLELASVLSGLRLQGAGYLHGGPFVTRYAEATAAVGLPVDATVLRNAVPAYAPAVELEIDDAVAFFTPPPAANGLLAAELYELLTYVVSFTDASPVQGLHDFLEASAQAFADRSGWLAAGGLSRLPYEQVTDGSLLYDRLDDLGRGPHRPAATLQPTPTAVVEPAGGTGFVAGDRNGDAVACSLTMNGLFGAQRIAPGTGMVLAAPPPNGLSVSPVAVVVGSRAGRLYMAAAGGDGAAAATSVVRVMLELLENERTVRDALAVGRVHHNGVPDVAFVEDRVPADQIQGLLNLGHEVLTLPAMGLVTVFNCPNSLNEKGECLIGEDPRGYGLSRVAQ